MKIELSQPFAANGKVDEFDIKQMKKSLNRLGYYQPYEKVGITGIADMGVFDALKTFQKDQGLLATGSAKPDDETVRALNKEVSKTPEGQYIWRTVEDDKVRKGHAAFNRTVRDWSDDPDPGEEFNCRCWAESLNAVALTQEITSEIYDLSDSWGNIEFIWYFYFGRGMDITLPQIGLFEPVIKHTERIMFDRVKSQVADKAKETGSGAFTGSWSNSYEFEDLVYSLGSVTIRGRFGGTVQKDGNVLNVQANAEYEFYDEFTDPISVRQLVLGTSEVATLPPSLLGGTVLLTTDLAGTPFRITGSWTTEMVNPHFRVHVKSESCGRPATWIKALKRKRKSFYPCASMARAVCIQGLNADGCGCNDAAIAR